MTIKEKFMNEMMESQFKNMSRGQKANDGNNDG